MNKKLLGCLSVIAALFMSGCATNLTKPAAAPQPASVKFGTFANVEMAALVVESPYDESGANRKAAKKIEELLQRDMAMVFPELNSTELKPGKTLLIKPRIKEIKFIGGAARFWVGAMAGSSAVLMDTTFVDKDSGEIIAQPEFYDQAAATGGSWSVGATDNMMLDNVVRQIISYSTANR